MEQQVTRIALSQIIPGANDRTIFDEDKLGELAASIAEHGLIQPISVRLQEDADVYQIICGERRFRALTLLRAVDAPCLILEVTEQEASAMMLAENVARADLDIIDEALAYQARHERYGWSVKDIAAKAGVSSVRVLFRMKLLRLDSTLQHLVRTSQLPLGYAQIMVDAGLEHADQFRAMRALGTNPTPTPAWFRRVVSEIAEQSQQNTMLDDDFMAAPELTLEPAAAPDEPPTPATAVPPALGDTLAEVIANHITFWSDAAGRWAQLGKNFKCAECEAAAKALRLTLNAI